MDVKICSRVSKCVLSLRHSGGMAAVTDLTSLVGVEQRYYLILEELLCCCLDPVESF